MTLKIQCNHHGGLVPKRGLEHRHWCQRSRIRPSRRHALRSLCYAGSSSGLDETLPSVPTTLFEEIGREANLVQERFGPVCSWFHILAGPSVSISSDS